MMSCSTLETRGGCDTPESAQGDGLGHRWEATLPPARINPNGRDHPSRTLLRDLQPAASTSSYDGEDDDGDPDDVDDDDDDHDDLDDDDDFGDDLDEDEDEDE